MATGFQFEPANTDDLCAALDRAINAYNDRNFFRGFRQAMQANFSGTRVPHNSGAFESLVGTASAKNAVADFRPETLQKIRADRRQAGNPRITNRLGHRQQEVSVMNAAIIANGVQRNQRSDTDFSISGALARQR